MPNDMTAEQAGYLDAKDRDVHGEWKYTNYNATGADPDTPNPDFETAYARGVGNYQRETGKGR